MEKEPLFLVGAERSGTTLLGLMLHHHPEISWRQEFEYVVDLIEDDDRYPDVSTYREWLETNRDFQLTGLTINTDCDYPELVNDFLIRHHTVSDGNIFGATVHRNFDKLLRIWKDAKFIHIVRDPRDVSRSCVKMGWAGNQWHGIDRWIEAERLWSKLEANLSKERYIHVRYEDLVREPEAILSQLCSFIGVEYSNSMMSYDEHTTYSRPDSSLISQWRSKQSDKEIQLVEAKCGELMSERGYELSGLNSLGISKLMLKGLDIQNRLSNIRFRITMLGFPLFLSDFLARKLGIRTWQKRTKLRINKVEIESLK